MDISPSPEFLQACREVLGGDTPAIVITTMRDDPDRFDKVRQRHAEIVDAKRGAANDNGPEAA